MLSLKKTHQNNSHTKKLLHSKERQKKKKCQKIINVIKKKTKKKEQVPTIASILNIPIKVINVQDVVLRRFRWIQRKASTCVKIVKTPHFNWFTRRMAKLNFS